MLSANKTVKNISKHTVIDNLNYKHMIIKFDKTLLKYQLIVLMSKIFGIPKYQYHWYECAIKVRKEDIQKKDFLLVRLQFYLK